MFDSADLITQAGLLVDVAGVLAIVIGFVTGTVQFFYDRLSPVRAEGSYVRYRQGLGKSLLLGLEILVAGDIIRTVAVSPTFTSVGVLAIIVVIRTFLSWSLQLEVEGRWPWQAKPESGKIAGTPPPRDS